MNAEEFRDLVRISMDWEHHLEMDDDNSADRIEDGYYFHDVKLTLWEKTITDSFVVQRGKWYCEQGEGITVDTPLTVWQWIAMRFAWQIGGNVG